MKRIIWIAVIALVIILGVAEYIIHMGSLSSRAENEDAGGIVSADASIEDVQNPASSPEQEAEEDPSVVPISDAAKAPRESSGPEPTPVATMSAESPDSAGMTESPSARERGEGELDPVP